MSAYAIQKNSCDGIGYSIAELNDVRHVFAAAVPRRGETLRAQAADALQIIETVNDVHGAGDSIVHQAVFVADAALIDECRQIMRDFYGPNMPVTTYIPQPPCEGQLLAIETMGMGRKNQDVKVRRVNENLALVQHNGITWVHAAIAPQACCSHAYDQAAGGFRQLGSLLANANIRMDQVLRTWLYQGGIVAEEGESQRYKELNRARADAYRGIDFLKDRLPKTHRGHVYPASTGIGADGRGLAISAIALATERTDIMAVPLENPLQTPAYQYPSRYSPTSPQFSRAMAVSCGNMATIFISGTASVTHSEVRHIGDAGAQTHQTLDNIAALIDEKNLSNHGLPGLGTSLDGLGHVRVYIKRQEDYVRIRAVCEKRLGELPTIYALADVCRPDWLVEIEGVAISRKDSGVRRTGEER